MSKPYWSGGNGRGNNFLDDPFDSASFNDDTPTGGIRTEERYNDGFYSNGGFRTTDEYRHGQSASDYSAHDYDEYDEYDEEDGVYYHSDTRWRLVAGMAVAVLLAAVLAIVLVMRGGDETENTAQSSPATSTAPRTVVATIPPSPAPPPPVQLSPETVVTVTTPPPAPPVTAAAPPPPETVPAPEVAVPPPAPAVDPRTVTYTVTGTKQMVDLVSVIYTDEQGLPRTEVNVALPWSKTLVLNPGVEFESVTATSLTGALNCVITDAAGAPVVAQNNNAMIATCTG